MKIRPVGVEMVHTHTNRRTNRHDQVTIRFSKICERA